MLKDRGQLPSPEQTPGLPKCELYDATGNMVGVVDLSLSHSYTQFKDNYQLRALLQQWGKAHRADSVMVLLEPREANPNLPYTIVFEPSGEDFSDVNAPGGISTACGNGFRAVADHLSAPEDTSVAFDTPTGIRTVDIVGEAEERSFRVNMGTLTTHKADLMRYANLPDATSEQIVYQPYSDELASAIQAAVQDHQIHPGVLLPYYSFGLTGTRDHEGVIDGEPHMISYVDARVLGDLGEDPNEALRKVAIAIGPAITKNRSLFPYEVNANFAALVAAPDKVSMLLATHERNLGDDPDHCVTAACGTGSTVAAAILLNKLLQQREVDVRNYGGTLRISTNGEAFYLSGPARKVT